MSDNFTFQTAVAFLNQNAQRISDLADRLQMNTIQVRSMVDRLATEGDTAQVGAVLWMSNEFADKVVAERQAFLERKAVGTLERATKQEERAQAKLERDAAKAAAAAEPKPVKEKKAKRSSVAPKGHSVNGATDADEGVDIDALLAETEA